MILYFLFCVLCRLRQRTRCFVGVFTGGKRNAARLMEKYQLFSEIRRRKDLSSGRPLREFSAKQSSIFFYCKMTGSFFTDFVVSSIDMGGAIGLS